MREMIALYLMGHLASTIVLSAVCLKWARDEVTGLLRLGLRLILAGLLLDALGFTLAKVTAVVARWLGYDLDFLSTTVAPPAAALGALIYSAGFVLPRLGSAAAVERQSLATYRALRLLWSAVRTWRPHRSRNLPGGSPGGTCPATASTCWRRTSATHSCS